MVFIYQFFLSQLLISVIEIEIEFEPRKRKRFQYFLEFHIPRSSIKNERNTFRETDIKHPNYAGNAGIIAVLGCGRSVDK